jgi:predicted nucleic acid-binding protein
MKIYLDTCSLQRPLDSKTQIRIILETEAVLGILSLCESGGIELVSSEVLLFETRRNPNVTRQQYALEVLSKAETFVVLSEQIEERARAFNTAGIKPLDALHLASAEEAEAEYLCTCDDQFLKQAIAVRDVRVRVISPIELIEEIEKWLR